MASGSGDGGARAQGLREPTSYAAIPAEKGEEIKYGGNFRTAG